jgi:phosphatidylserine/phosphatidylglycerophosphate/cardiolipin synthase-like enzyme
MMLFSRSRTPGTLALSFCLLLASIISSTAVKSPASQPAAGPADLSVFFSPNGGCTSTIVQQLSAARRDIKVQAYSFTSAEIAKAIADAFERGVKVTVVLDKSQKTEKYTGATYLANHHVPVLIDSKHAIAHNKIIIIDGATVLTGSFNFTKAAEERNAENLLIIRNHPAITASYLDNFADHLGHSEPYTQ